MARRAWVLLWIAVPHLGAWARWLNPWLLFLVSALAVMGIVSASARWNSRTFAGLLLLTAAAFGFHIQGSLHDPASGRALPAEREEEISRSLAERFELLLENGDRAVQEGLSALAELPSRDLQEAFSRIRRRREVAALAAYGPDGTLAAWAGVHRGPVPPPVREAESPYLFGGGPLFRYLYFTAGEPQTGGTVMAAVLLQTHLPGGLEGGGFVSRFRRATGIPIRISAPERVSGSAVWDLRWGGDPLLSVSVEAEGAPVSSGGGRPWQMAGVLLLALLAWGVLVVGGRGLAGRLPLAGGSLLAFAALFPLGRAGPGLEVSSPAQFLLPGPVGVTLAQLIAVLLTGGILAGLAGASVRRSLPTWVAVLWVAAAFPLLEAVFAASPSPTFLARGSGNWLAYESALAILLTISGYLGFGGHGDRRPGTAGRWLIPVGLLLTLALTFGVAVWARARPEVPSVVFAAWAVAALPLFVAARERRRAQGLISWVLAALLGSTAALTGAWRSGIQSQRARAEVQLGEMGSEPDPYLEYRLLRMAEAADSLDRLIGPPVELLFEIWAQTGVHGDPIPMWLTLWSRGDLPEEDLPMGVQGDRPPEADDFLEAARRDGHPTLRHLGLLEARYLVLMPLEGGRVVSAVVPPSGSLSLSSPLGPIFASAQAAPLQGATLIPLVPSETAPSGDPLVTWERKRGGWRGERILEFPEGRYAARMTVALPGLLHMVAKGTLTVSLNLLLALLLWGTGRILSEGREFRLQELKRFLGSFRARVTLALFAFFSLSLAIFGTLSFRTLSGAAVRTASALAERIVEDGATFYLEVQGSISLLAREVGADLLEYRRGELRGGSSEELVALGLYEGWIPQPVFRALDSRDEVATTSRSSLGGWDYVVAYRRLPDGDILATPVPIGAGATAVRRQEVADLLGFAIVLGAGISLGLALLVGRTLSRPIETLQVASERVGAGNLKVRLPEDRSDEFGAVFSAFNRMVGGIRKARRALLRTTRRTQAIVEEAATGVIALDASGRVTLVNPRAQALLGGTVQVGTPLSAGQTEAGELTEWVSRYFRDGIREATTEIQLARRRIRVRARRISGERPLGGAVLSLEDVTDELRTERILAWGEMAQQVAHEVKNPLTPMKLGVQHLERAWQDQRPDFGEILEKNVAVILREIDHLAAIARSFSRFGAPRAAGELPLEAVDLGRVVEDVLALYKGGRSPLQFVSEVPGGLPPVSAREAELREVLINLLENARAAIPEEGRVTIRAVQEEEGVILSVEDTGRGIPAELLPRIFEPHFSTRSTGAGLGLAIVRRLVESWEGSVSVESRLGEGTEVRMTLREWLSRPDGSQQGKV